MVYRCEAASVEGFVQQLACNLVNKGYWFYVAGRIPEKKDPALIDDKLIRLYRLDMSKWARARRKAQGKANLAYLRYGRFFVLLATQGEHLLYERESFIQDIRRRPIVFHGYSIGCGRGSDGRYHASVKIGTEAFAQMQAHFLSIATHCSAESLSSEFRTIAYIPFARVRRQLLRLVGEVNAVRRSAGFAQVPISALNLRRTIYRPFKEQEIPCGAETRTQSVSVREADRG